MYQNEVYTSEVEEPLLLVDDHSEMAITYYVIDTHYECRNEVFRIHKFDNEDDAKKLISYLKGDLTHDQYFYVPPTPEQLARREAFHKSVSTCNKCGTSLQSYHQHDNSQFTHCPTCAPVEIMEVS